MANKTLQPGGLACEWQPACGGSRHPAPTPRKKAREPNGDTLDVVSGQRTEQRASGRWGAWGRSAGAAGGEQPRLCATNKGSRTHACVCPLPNNTCVRARSCPTLCSPTDCSPPGSSAHGGSPGKNSGVGCHALLQGIFQTEGWTPSPAEQADPLRPEPPRKSPWPKEDGHETIPQTLGTIPSFPTGSGTSWPAHPCPFLKGSASHECKNTHSGCILQVCLVSVGNRMGPLYTAVSAALRVFRRPGVSRDSEEGFSGPALCRATGPPAGRPQPVQSWHLEAYWHVNTRYPAAI